MRETFWRNLVGGMVVVVWIATTLLVFTSAWDQLAQEIYGWWGRSPGGFVVSDLAKSIVLVSVSGGALYFFAADPVRTWFKNWRRASKPEEAASRVSPVPVPKYVPAMPLPNQCIDFRGLMDRAGRWQSEHSGSERPKDVDVARKLYDALQNDHLMAWGRPSSVYPPDVAPPHPKHEFIDPSFWTEHLIEEMEMISGRIPRVTKTSDQSWQSMTLAPASKFNNRAVAPCYWDLVFNRSGAGKLFPLRHDWMSS